MPQNAAIALTYSSRLRAMLTVEFHSGRRSMIISAGILSSSSCEVSVSITRCAMARMLKDPEMVYFLAELQHTPAGRSYRRAWNNMISALRNMQSLRGESQVLDLNRRAYAEASREASVALDVLTQTYSWPLPFPEGALLNGETIYRPPA